MFPEFKRILWNRVWTPCSRLSLARISLVTRNELDSNEVPRGFSIREERCCLYGAEGGEGQKAGGEV